MEEDIPERLLLPNAVVQPMVDLRKGNWRYAMENAVDDAHAKYLHRKTLWHTFNQLPGYGTGARMAPSVSAGIDQSRNFGDSQISAQPRNMLSVLSP